MWLQSAFLASWSDASWCALMHLIKLQILMFWTIRSWTSSITCWLRSCLQLWCSSFYGNCLQTEGSRSTTQSIREQALGRQAECYSQRGKYRKAVWKSYHPCPCSRACPVFYTRKGFLESQVAIVCKSANPIFRFRKCNLYNFVHLSAYHLYTTAIVCMFISQ